MENQLSSQLITIFFGFILTTVGGGLLGFFFQNRTWKHQHSIQLLDSERTTARTIYETISVLMDKRLYRMRRLYWYLEEYTPEDDGLDKRLQEYQNVLYEWNDNLIRNLALIQAYFGDEIRNYLEQTIYEEFKRIGGLLEEQVREWKNGEKETNSSIGRELNALGSLIYRLNFRMIRLLQQGDVGLSRNQP